MREQIEKALQPLIGLPLWHWSRAADMACFGFGASRPSTDRSGEPIVIAEWALHIQCPWRIVGPVGIVVGRYDLYYPAGEYSGDLADFDYEGPFPNLRDARLEALFISRDSDPLVVEDGSGDNVGGFQLTLSDGFALEGFPDHSHDSEDWRLFRSGSGAPHFVVEGRVVRGT